MIGSHFGADIMYHLFHKLTEIVSADTKEVEHDDHLLEPERPDFSLDQVTDVLANAGLRSSNLIVGIDFTMSNEWTGKRSFDRKSLHHIGNGSNPYEQALSMIGDILASLGEDEDNPIPCYGFGDGMYFPKYNINLLKCRDANNYYYMLVPTASTHDQDVFSFYFDGRFCNGLQQVLSRYREIVPLVQLSGPTSFAPIIEMALTVVEQSGGQYHVLVILTDGQATKHVDTQCGQLSTQQKKSAEAIVQASKLPLSIIFVGVGDEPWDMMKELLAQAFRNFQITLGNISTSQKLAKFALAALISQHKATIEGDPTRKGIVSNRVSLPPFTPTDGVTSFNTSKPSISTTLPYDSSSFNTSKPSSSTTLPYGSLSFNTSKPSNSTTLPYGSSSFNTSKPSSSTTLPYDLSSFNTSKPSSFIGHPYGSSSFNTSKPSSSTTLPYGSSSFNTSKPSSSTTLPYGSSSFNTSKPSSSTTLPYGSSSFNNSKPSSSTTLPYGSSSFNTSKPSSSTTLPYGLSSFNTSKPSSSTGHPYGSSSFNTSKPSSSTTLPYGSSSFNTSKPSSSTTLPYGSSSFNTSKPSSSTGHPYGSSSFNTSKPSSSTTLPNGSSSFNTSKPSSSTTLPSTTLPYGSSSFNTSKPSSSTTLPYGSSFNTSKPSSSTGHPYASSSFNTSKPSSSTTLPYGSSSFNTSKPSSSTTLPYGSSSFNSSSPSHPIGFPPNAPPLSEDRRICDIFLRKFKSMAFGCGHMVNISKHKKNENKLYYVFKISLTCEECTEKLEMCLTWQRPIEFKLNLHF
ncbi:hypothetical protein GQ457_07G001010 [Hibiscus cannabinus]